MNFKNLILFLFLSISLNAYSQMFWGNVNGKDASVNLTNQIAHQNDLKTIEVGTLDPTASAVNASDGSVYINASGIFQKQDAGASTNWQPLLIGPSAAVVDECMARWDGTSGILIQDTVFCVDDAGIGTGLTQQNIDNIRIDGNSISSQNVNGDVTFDPNGTGKVVVNADLDVQGTITQIAQSSLVVTNATITVNDNGNQATADSNDAGMIVEMSDATDAQIGYDSATTSKWIAGEVGSLVEVATVSHSQTLTNKSIDADSNTITNIENADIKAAAAIARSKIASGTINHVLINDGAGAISSEAQLSNTRGGTGGDSSGSTGVAQVTAGAWSYGTIDLTSQISGVLPIANGGTNSSTALNNNFVMISSVGLIAESSTVTTTELGLLDGRTYIPDVVGVDNRVATYDGVNSLDSSANFTFDGSILAVTGQADIDSMTLNGSTVSTSAATNLNLNPGTTGQISFDLDGGQLYNWTLDGANTLALQSKTAATASNLTLFSSDGDATDFAGFNVKGSGAPDGANFHNLSMNWNSTNTQYEMHTGSGGTGNEQNLSLYAGAGNLNQIFLERSTGFVSIRGSGPASELDVNGDITLSVEGEVRFSDFAGGEYNAFKSPTTLTGNTTFILPDGDGTANQILETNGSAVLSWVTPTGASTTQIVRVATGNGHGSTNTAIRRFSVTIEDTGADITYADSATLGATFTINADGVYVISYNDERNSVVARVGISLNSTQLSTTIRSITQADRVCIAEAATPEIANCSVGISLSSGDVIRAHTGGAVTGGTRTSFTITQVEKF